METPAKSLDEAIDALGKLRSYAPYRFGGKWFVSHWGETGYFYRSKAALTKAAARAGLSEIAIAIVKPG